MNTNQERSRLGAHIKLLKRHILEFKTLLIHQKQVRHLAQEKNRQSPTLYDKHMVMLERVLRLTHLMERQAGERRQMKTRHQQEEAALQQAINAHK